MGTGAAIRQGLNGGTGHGYLIMEARPISASSPGNKGGVILRSRLNTRGTPATTEKRPYRSLCWSMSYRRRPQKRS